jgi:hypothetical protein
MSPVRRVGSSNEKDHVIHDSILGTIVYPIVG